MQSDYEVEREAGADPSWHSDSDVSTSTYTTASTSCESAQRGHRGTMVGEVRDPCPVTLRPSPRSPEEAIETMHHAGCKDGTTLRLRASEVARDGWRWQTGHKP